MSDRTLAAFHVDSRRAVSQDVSANQLQAWMEAGDLDKVAVQLIPWVVGDHCLGAVRNSFLRGNGGAELEYDDVHAEAMALMWELLHKWKPGGMTVMSWVATYTKQGLYKYCIRTLTRDNMDSLTPAYADDETQDEDGNQFIDNGGEALTASMTPLTEDLVELADLRDFIAKHNLGLTPRQLQAFEMHYNQDLTMTDIAVIMNVSKQTVQESVASTRSKLRRALSYT